MADINDNDDWFCLACEPKPLKSTHQSVYYSLCKVMKVGEPVGY